MRQQIHFQLVFETRSQRFYKASAMLTTGIVFGSKFNVAEKLKEYATKYVKPEFVQYVPTEGYDIICISDATTHIERLCFVGMTYPVDGVQRYGRTQVQIDGSHTFKMYGGDSDSIKPDEVYLRHLAKINNYNYCNTIQTQTQVAA